MRSQTSDSELTMARRQLSVKRENVDMYRLEYPIVRKRIC